MLRMSGIRPASVSEDIESESCAKIIYAIPMSLRRRYSFEP